jgi:regulator of sirC expression with transglutaminase-like and TPR domain
VKTLGGKRVVVEYDTSPRAPSKPATVASTSSSPPDEDAISRARNAYAAGNQRLFAGDADGAIKDYRQALDAYPGYVAGYRGLGLAYEQLGDKPKALKALQTYASAAPTAKDIAIIKKRITRLRAP